MERIVDNRIREWRTIPKAEPLPLSIRLHAFHHLLDCLKKLFWIYISPDIFDEPLVILLSFDHLLFAFSLTQASGLCLGFLPNSLGGMSLGVLVLGFLIKNAVKK